MKSHLKVKVFSLSAEMTYIRRQEEKWKNKARISRQREKENKDIRTYTDYAINNFWSLRNHRLECKVEARHTHLAYGFMRRVPYSKMEPICYGVLKGYGSSEPNWERIEAMVARFSGDEAIPDVMQKFSEWLDDAKKWYEGNKERIPDAWEQAELIRKIRANDADYQKAKKERSEAFKPV